MEEMESEFAGQLSGDTDFSFLFNHIRQEQLDRQVEDRSLALALTIVYSVLAITGFAANLLFCVLIWRNEKLHTVTHMLMTNLAVSNILFLCFQPSYIITTYLLQTNFVFGTIVCKTSFSISYVTSTASFYFMSMVAIDRWLAIFRRKQRLGRSGSIWMTVSAWAISVVVAVPYLYSSHVEDVYALQETLHKHLKVDTENTTSAAFISDSDILEGSGDLLKTHWLRCTSDTASHAVLIWTVALQYIIPLLIMMPTYGHLAHFVWKRAPVGLQSREKREKAHRRRRKLVVTLLAIVLFLIVCWIPLFFVNILMNVAHISGEQYTRAYIYCSIVTLVGVTITPIFYLINDGCREQVMRFFCCKVETNNDQERQTMMTTNQYPAFANIVTKWRLSTEVCAIHLNNHHTFHVA